MGHGIGISARLAVYAQLVACSMYTGTNLGTGTLITSSSHGMEFKD